MNARRNLAFAFSMAFWGSQLVFVAQMSSAQTPSTQPETQAVSDPSTETLDRVVAVVNHKAILSSELDEEMQLAVLDPGRAGRGVLTPQRALQQSISRAMIQQQIRQEDLETAEPTTEDLSARLKEIRTELPACVREKCATEEGWKAFLASHDLTPDRVESYLRSRLEILRFIEVRFREGIRISPEEIQTYYHETLLPQYAPGEKIPPLEQVSQRIQEILLQQQVNLLFSGWLENLRKQGEIEVLDPSLEAADTPGSAEPGRRRGRGVSAAPPPDARVNETPSQQGPGIE